MARANEHYVQLKGSYLFAEVERRTAAFRQANPQAEVLKLSIGDVTRPLVAPVVEAMQKAAAEMGRAETFRGYGPYEGYDFLRQAIAQNDYAGLPVGPDEIFVSDGAKSDTSCIADIFAADSKVAVCDPVYPVYVDSNVMAGRAGAYDAQKSCWSGLTYLPCREEDCFLPQLPPDDAPAPDLIYLCSPNNPTGVSMPRSALQEWVDYANAHGSVILFDAAYEAFIVTPGVARSIYECKGATTCAIEFRSFSKTAGFTGTRCGFAVIPKALKLGDVSMHDLWYRRQSTKTNGVSYPVQRAAEAVYSPLGRRLTKENISFYQGNARVILEGLKGAGFTVYGGVDSPYIWMKCPRGLDSWTFFDQLLEQCQVVGTPGAGFGACGQGYLRLTSFNTLENTQEAVRRIVERFH